MRKGLEREAAGEGSERLRFCSWTMRVKTRRD
jgi:hypothetical protein